MISKIKNRVKLFLAVCSYGFAAPVLAPLTHLTFLFSSFSALAQGQQCVIPQTCDQVNAIVAPINPAAIFRGCNEYNYVISGELTEALKTSIDPAISVLGAWCERACPNAAFFGGLDTSRVNFYAECADLAMVVAMYPLFEPLCFYYPTNTVTSTKTKTITDTISSTTPTSTKSTSGTASTSISSSVTDSISSTTYTVTYTGTTSSSRTTTTLTVTKSISISSSTSSSTVTYTATHTSTTSSTTATLTLTTSTTSSSFTDTSSTSSSTTTSTTTSQTLTLTYTITPTITFTWTVTSTTATNAHTSSKTSSSITAANKTALLNPAIHEDFVPVAHVATRNVSSLSDLYSRYLSNEDFVSKRGAVTDFAVWTIITLCSGFSILCALYSIREDNDMGLIERAIGKSILANGK